MMQMLKWLAVVAAAPMSLNRKHRRIYRQQVNWRQHQVQSFERRKVIRMNVQTHRNSHFFHIIAQGMRIAWALAKNIDAVANSIANVVSKVCRSHWKSNAMNVICVSLFLFLHFFLKFHFFFCLHIKPLCHYCCFF